MATVTDILEEIQRSLFTRARTNRDDHTRRIDDLAEFEAFFAGDDE